MFVDPPPPSWAPYQAKNKRELSRNGSPPPPKVDVYKLPPPAERKLCGGDSYINRSSEPVGLHWYEICDKTIYLDGRRTISKVPENGKLSFIFVGGKWYVNNHIISDDYFVDSQSG